MSPAKPWYTSFTMWLNIGSIVAIILGTIADSWLQLGLPVQVGVWATAALAIVNAALRVLKTNQPLSVGSSVPSVSTPQPPPQ